MYNGHISKGIMLFLDIGTLVGFVSVLYKSYLRSRNQMYVILWSISLLGMPAKHNRTLCITLIVPTATHVIWRDNDTGPLRASHSLKCSNIMYISADCSPFRTKLIQLTHTRHNLSRTMKWSD